MIKILHVYKTYYPLTYGGIEKVIYDLTNSKEGYEFGIITVGKKNHIKKYKGVKVYYFKKSFEIFSCPFSFSLLFNFYKLIKKYDIIHYHYPWPFMDLLSLIFANNKKKIITYHSDIISQKILSVIIFPITWLFLNSANQIISTSRNYKRSSRILRLFKKKTKVIPLGIDIDFYKKNYSKNNFNYWKRKLNFKYVLFCGSSRNYKGLNFLLKAWTYLSKYDVKLVLAGKIKKSIINDISRFGLNEKVTIIQSPNEKNKLSLIKNCLFCILPSNKRSEAFGLFLLEAMFFKKSVISTELNTGTSYVNKKNVTGLVVKPNDYLTLKDKIIFLIKNNIKSKIFGKNGYKRLKKKFDSKLNNQEYFTLYKKII